MTRKLLRFFAAAAIAALSGMAQAQATTPAAAPSAAPTVTATAIFAGGCFWCMEADFEKLPGVIEAVSGYTAGKTPKPTYRDVSNGHTGHTEAVRVVYDAARVSYGQLVEHFWRNIDPTEKNRQFCDVGSQYRSGIYWLNDEQRQVVEASHAALLKSGRFKTIHTELAPATTFHEAEDYHQDYAKKNSVRYSYYRLSCGRDARLKKLWG